MASNVLLNSTNAAVAFDPANKKHRAAYASFLANTRWPENIRFMAEWPSTSVVATVQSKLALYAIRAEVKELDTAKLAA